MPGKELVILTEQNCLYESDGRFDYRGLISTTGIICQDLHSYEEVLEIDEFYAELIDDIITIKFKSPIIKQMQVMINLQTNNISNQYFQKTKECTHSIALSRVFHQAQFARKYEFKSISLNAVREAELFGYKVWGKFGFFMTNEEQKIKFREWALSKNYNFTCIDEVYLNPQAKSDWYNDGFGWTGKFDLSEGSRSWDVLIRVNEAFKEEKLQKLMDKINGVKGESEIEKAPRDS